jgi:Immunoglobulin-like domain of bacterial spore germination
MKKVVIILGVVIIILLGILFFYNPAQGPTTATSTNSAPASQEAISPDGRVTIFSPLEGALVTSPVTIQGSVDGGGWFNEAVFPIKVLDGDGTMIGQGMAQAGGAPGSWMSTGTVSFSATISFTAPKYATGTIVLAKDNPSGSAVNAEQFSVPVKFQ